MIFMNVDPVIDMSPRRVFPCHVLYLATTLYLSTQIFNFQLILSSREAE